MHTASGSVHSLITEETMSQKSQVTSFRLEKKFYLARELEFRNC